MYAPRLCRFLQTHNVLRLIIAVMAGATYAQRAAASSPHLGPSGPQPNGKHDGSVCVCVVVRACVCVHVFNVLAFLSSSISVHVCVLVRVQVCLVCIL